ncbi:MAG TPA: hypothetical protein VEJ18_07070, partial [Planctomycetota bacterium]|nr:hypothetical protein [Planctomycetota bacterium]
AAAVAVLAAVATLALPQDGGLGRSPYDYQAAWRTAEAARAAGDLAEADVRYAIAGDLWPAHPGLQGAVGLYHWTRYAETADRAHLERSSKAFRRLFEQRPADVRDVMSFLSSGTPAEREALLPALPEAWGAWAGWLAERGFTAQAQAAFERGAGTSTAAHDRYAASLEAIGQWGLEAAVRDRRLRLASDPAAHAAAARAWLRLGVHEKAMEQARYASRTDPASPSHRALKAEILLAQGRLEDALAAMGEALSLAPRDPALLRRRAEIQARRADPRPR